MRRRLSPEEEALWGKVVASVRPLGAPAAPARAEAERAEPPPRRRRPSPGAVPVPARRPEPGTTLDGSWDRRLARGLASPHATVDLHGHNLETAWSLLDRRLDQAIASGARIVLLITGKPPPDGRRPARRGAIRAAIGDWLAASRHAGDLAAVRNAHPRHGGAGALYIVLRRRRDRPLR